MSNSLPSPREVLEILSRELDFDTVRKKFPGIDDDYLKEILSDAARAAKTGEEPPNLPVNPLSSECRWIAYIDGASRGNPGEAASAAWIHTPEGVLELKKSIGVGTNNVAEYEALLLALETAVERGVDSIEVRSDSELLVKQNKGLYKVKNQNLSKLFIRAKNLEKKFKFFTIRHIPREENAQADRLANEALDESMG